MKKSKSAALTEAGVDKVEKALRVANVYAPEHIELVHHVHQALKAHAMFKLDVDYVVKEGQVIIVDEFTGRLMPGRRYSDGLHQALEAKEGVRIENENQTLASHYVPELFPNVQETCGHDRNRRNRGGGISEIYNLDVMVIPTNMPMIRTDHPDMVYKTVKAKYNAICR